MYKRQHRDRVGYPRRHLLPAARLNAPQDVVAPRLQRVDLEDARFDQLAVTHLSLIHIFLSLRFAYCFNAS